MEQSRFGAVQVASSMTDGLAFLLSASAFTVYALALTAAFLYLQIRELRRDIRLRTKYEFYAEQFALNLLLARQPELSALSKSTRAWGSTGEEHVFLYIINLFESVFQMQREGIIPRGDPTWENYMRETFKSPNLRDYWAELERLKIYDASFVDGINRIISQVPSDQPP